MTEEGLTYSEAGVDIDKADNLVSRIKNKVKGTYTEGVIGELGSFGGFFAPDFSGMEEPVLVAGTDGVGTKLKIAQKMGIHDTIGMDLVAMCINDILTQGAVPLFFLDYLACGSLELEVNEEIVSGIVKGCKQAGTALIGGETAEMPGFYAEGKYELVGFAVGMVDRGNIITGENIEAGDVILGLPSTGVHSNGFSLIRYLINNRDDLSLDMDFPYSSNSLGGELLKPTKIYTAEVSPLLDKFEIKGMAHITGGGLKENIPRILPSSLQAVLDYENWPSLPIFDFIQDKGKIKAEEMFKTFNMGIGMIIVVSPAAKASVSEHLKKQGQEVFTIGKIESGKKDIVIKKEKEGDDN